MKPFFDTNILVYAFTPNDSRNTAAEALLNAGGIVSLQVLNEFVAVSRRKLGKTWPEVHRSLDHILRLCPHPVPLTLATHQQALQIAERHNYTIFDSLILAAALRSGATTLYSEDMHHSHKIDTLTIRNPSPPPRPAK